MVRNRIADDLPKPLKGSARLPQISTIGFHPLLIRKLRISATKQIDKTNKLPTTLRVAVRRLHIDLMRCKKRLIRSAKKGHAAVVLLTNLFAHSNQELDFDHDDVVVVLTRKFRSVTSDEPAFRSYARVTKEALVSVAALLIEHKEASSNGRKPEE